MNQCMESPGGHCKAFAVCDQEQSKRLFPYGIPLGVLRRRVVSSPAQMVQKLCLVPGCIMGDFNSKSLELEKSVWTGGES